MSNLISIHRVHVVNYHLVEDLIAVNAHVAAQISGNNVLSNMLPLARAVEILIDPSFTTEGAITYLTTKRKVFKPVLETIESS